MIRSPLHIVYWKSHQSHGFIFGEKVTPLNEDDRFAPAPIKGIIFPKYNPDITDIQITQLNQSQAMHELADNAFNFSLMAHRGFKALTSVVEQADSYHIEYRDAADVKAFLEQEVLEYV